MQEPYRTTCLVPAHDGRIETLAFDTHHRRIASAGSGCTKVWQLDMEGQNFPPLYFIMLIMLRRTFQTNSYPRFWAICHSKCLLPWKRLKPCDLLLESHQVYASVQHHLSCLSTIFARLCIKIENWVKDSLPTRMYVQFTFLFQSTN